MHRKWRCHRHQNIRAQFEDRFANASQVSASPSSKHARTICKQIRRRIASGGAAVINSCAHTTKTDSAKPASGGATVIETCAHNLKTDSAMHRKWRRHCAKTCAHSLSTDSAMHRKWRRHRHQNMRAQFQDKFGDASQAAAPPSSQYARAV